MGELGAWGSNVRWTQLEVSVQVRTWRYICTPITFEGYLGSLNLLVVLCSFQRTVQRQTRPGQDFHLPHSPRFFCGCSVVPVLPQPSAPIHTNTATEY